MTTTNGTAKKAPTPEELRAEVKRLRREVRPLLEMARLKHLQESLLLLGDDFGGSDLFDRLRDNVSGERWVPLSVPTDRRHGEEWPIYRTEPELGQLRQRSRILCRSNAYAKGLLRNLTNYNVGKGYSYKIVAEGGAGADKEAQVAPGLTSEQLVGRVQSFIDRWCKLNRWNGATLPGGTLVMAGSREREVYRRVKRDGECFLRFFTEGPGVDAGFSVVRFVEPEQVVNPPGGDYRDGWTLGIRHQMDPFEDVEAAEEYHFVYQDESTRDREADQTPTGDLVPADEVVHIKNVDDDCTLSRGLPEFVFDTLAAFDRASKVARNLSIGAALRAATAEIWQYSTGTQQQVSQLLNGLQDDVKTDPISGQTTPTEKLRPGSIRRIPAGQELVNHAEDQTPQYVQAVQSDLRQGVASVCAPEFMTGDASNANYASTEQAGAPFVRASEAEQEHFKGGFACVVWRAITYAVRGGLLPREALTLVDLQVEAAAVVHTDDLQKTQKNAILAQNKVKSPQTWQLEEGLDPETEGANWEEWDRRFGQQGGGLPMPGDQPPGEGPPAPGGGGEGPPGQGQPPDTFAGLPEGLLESVLAEAGFSGVITDRAGRKRRYVNGKEVKGAGKQAARRAEREAGKAARKAERQGGPVTHALAAAEHAVGEAGKKLLAALHAPNAKAHEAAVAAARAAGLPEQRAQRLGRVLAVADAVLQWGVAAPAVHAAASALGAPELAALGLSKAAAMVPAASLAYAAAGGSLALLRRAREALTKGRAANG